MINKKLLDELKVITEEERDILARRGKIDRTLYMSETNNIVENEKMLSEGKLIAIRPHTRFVHFPEHYHDYVEIVYMCSGSTTHIIDGDTIHLQEGELLFLCQSAKQEIFPAGADDIAVNFIVLPEFFDQILHMIGEQDTPIKNFLIDCLKNRKSRSGYLHFEVADVLPVQNLIENLIWSLKNGVPNRRSINQITMGLLFFHLVNLTERIVHSNTSEEIVVKALRYVEENYKNGSLTGLAEWLHYDISSISREIKNKTGKTYTVLVQEKRLAQACYLLEHTDLTVDEIAINVGYENISFFYRIFKKHYGVTPKKYRKQQIK